MKACEDPRCLGHEILPRVPHAHVVDLDPRWAHVDWFMAIPGAEERVQLELPLEARPQ